MAKRSHHKARPSTRSKAKVDRGKAAQDKKYFRLLDLPPELRTTIYEHVFASTPVEITMMPCDPHPMLLTCKQIYNEAILIFYGMTNFYFDDHMDCFEWMEKLPKWICEAINTLSYHTEDEKIWIPPGSLEVMRWSIKERAGALEEYLADEGINLRPGVLKVCLLSRKFRVLWTKGAKDL